MGQIFQHANQDLHTLLTTLGIDEYNTTSMISTMMIAPATTDMQMAAVIMVVKALQRALRSMGATDVADTGLLDLQTASAIEQVTGPGWQSVPWYQTIQAVVWAAEHGVTVSPMRSAAPAMGYVPMAGITLPDMPGGLLGWAAIGAAAYYFFGRGKR